MAMSPYNDKEPVVVHEVLMKPGERTPRKTLAMFAGLIIRDLYLRDEKGLEVASDRGDDKDIELCVGSLIAIFPEAWDEIGTIHKMMKGKV